jgi:hypothetical protein
VRSVGDSQHDLQFAACLGGTASIQQLPFIRRNMSGIMIGIMIGIMSGVMLGPHLQASAGAIQWTRFFQDSVPSFQ